MTRQSFSQLKSFLSSTVEPVYIITPKSEVTSSMLTDSAETSKAKVTVEMPHSSMKMRAASQLPAVGPDDDLTGMLLQVGALTFCIT